MSNKQFSRKIGAKMRKCFIAHAQMTRDYIALHVRMADTGMSEFSQEDARLSVAETKGNLSGEEADTESAGNQSDGDGDDGTAVKSDSSSVRSRGGYRIL